MIKYLENLKLFEDSIYRFNNIDFLTIEDAINYMMTHGDEKDFYKRFKVLIIINQSAPDYFVCSEYTGIGKLALKDILASRAKERRVYFSTNMDRVYFESFDLYENNPDSCSFESFVFDYGLIYGIYTVWDNYMGRFTSTIFPYTFETTHDRIPEKVNDVYECGGIHICTICFYKYIDNGNIFTETFGWPILSIPVETFIYCDDSTPDLICEEG